MENIVIIPASGIECPEIIKPEDLGSFTFGRAYDPLRLKVLNAHIAVEPTTPFCIEIAAYFDPQEEIVRKRLNFRQRTANPIALVVLIMSISTYQPIKERNSRL